MKKTLIMMYLLVIAVLPALLTSCETGKKDRDEPKPPIPSPPPLCKTCKGDFEIICPKCHGMEKIPCEQCKGLRGKRINCPDCNHGKIKTLFRGERDCDKCKGTGIITQYCSKCSGKGRVNCAKCNGTGKIDCPDCSPKPLK